MFSDLSIIEFTILAVAAIFVGLGKAGISGAGMVTIPIFAAILGGKPSTGFLLPLLVLADLTAIFYYRKNTRWEYIIKITPWVLLGVVIASFTGKVISDTVFNTILAVVIILGASIMIFKDFGKVPDSIFKSYAFVIVIGTLNGFVSMIGNASGAIMSIYLLSFTLHKKEFIATGAWFFFLLNILKLPIHIFVWKTITIQSLTNSAMLVVFIGLGMVIGFWLTKRISETIYRKLILILVFCSAIILFLK